MKDYPKVGTAVWVRKDGKVLLGMRKGIGAGTWCAPGGHFEMYELAEECAIRETQEEASIEISNIKLIAPLETLWKEMGKHWITLMYVADWKSGEPIAQPEEFEKWGWFEWDNLPTPLFYPTEQFVKTGVNPLAIL